MSLALARAVADAVLWEGYLLYPYRASSSKNRIRWQFGVLGPPDVARSGIAEDPSMHCECLLRSSGLESGDPTVRIHLRFLQLVRRQVQQFVDGDVVPVDELLVDGQSVLSFDEAVDCELPFGPLRLEDLLAGRSLPVAVPGRVQTEDLTVGQAVPAGRIVRTSRDLAGALTIVADRLWDHDDVFRLSCTVTNTSIDRAAHRDEATAVSFLGAHLLMEVTGGSFLSLLEPPADVETAANGCHQQRCWPVLAGAPGETDVVLASPIILYDYPAVAPESAGALFDSTEIDEILTLRVMTLTDEEKAAARATDPAAAAIIDRCESMPPQTLAQLHGVLRDPRLGLNGADMAQPRWNDAEVPTFGTPDGGPDPSPDTPWWDPGVDASVSPTTDSVMIDGVSVAKGALVRIRPRRRADAQDLFYAGQEAWVRSVYSDVDDNTHVAVVLTDDPAADLHEWYGRYLYFAPDELEPLAAVESNRTSVRQPKEK